MKYIINITSLIIFFGIVFFITCCKKDGVTDTQINVAGDWSFYVAITLKKEVPYPKLMSLIQKGNSVTGTIGSDSILGNFDGENINFKIIDTSGQQTAICDGKVARDSMFGTYTASSNQIGTWRAKKGKPAIYLINKLTITDRNGNGQTFYLGEEELVKEAKLYTGDLPPSSPGFDARFKRTGGAVETYPVKLDTNMKYEYPISISAALYPITFSWEIVNIPNGWKMVSIADGKFITVMVGSGYVRLYNAKEIIWAFKQ
jgi:hypothetical protein